MIIHQPERHLADETLRISARIELKANDKSFPEYLWFEVPASNQIYLSEYSNAFLTSLLMLSMYLEEPLEVRGLVSPHLAYGLLEWQSIFHSWYPDQFKQVDVKYERLEAMGMESSLGRVASAFSGGLDSLYTLWCNLPASQPNPAIRLSHAIFVHGFDIRLHQGDKYRLLFEHYREKLDQVGVELLSVRTNIYLFSQFRIKWELMHGGPLIGAALLFDKLLGKFLVNASASYNNVKPTRFGTSPLSDHWLSTETLEIFHFGSGEERIGKMITIQDWPLAWNVLRVCTNPQDAQGVDNCGHCTRCLLNKTRLELLGILPKFSTFKEPFHHKDLLRLALAMDGFPGADRMVLKAARLARRWDIALPMFLIYHLDRVKAFLVMNYYKRLSREKRYDFKRSRFASLAEKAPEKSG
jgi:hypothetical protein